MFTRGYILVFFLSFFFRPQLLSSGSPCQWKPSTAGPSWFDTRWRMFFVVVPSVQTSTNESISQSNNILINHLLHLFFFIVSARETKFQKRRFEAHANAHAFATQWKCCFLFFLLEGNLLRKYSYLNIYMLYMFVLCLRKYSCCFFCLINSTIHFHFFGICIRTCLICCSSSV